MHSYDYCWHGMVDISNIQSINKIINNIKINACDKLTLIHCAGIFGNPSFTENSFNAKQFIKTLETNLLGPSLLICQLITKTKNMPFRAITIGSTFCAIAPSYILLVFGRLLQGVGFGCSLALGVLLTTKLFDETKKGLAIGLYMTIAGFSKAIGHH